MKIDFASHFEEEIYGKLKKADVCVEYEPETLDYKRRTRKTYCGDYGSKKTFKKARYTPDFRIGTRIYIEAKGYFKPEKRAAMEDFLRSNPDVDLRFVFGADNWLTSKRVTKYSDWAKSLKVKYAIKEVPESWIKEARKQIADWRKSLQELQDSASRVHT